MSNFTRTFVILCFVFAMCSAPDAQAQLRVRKNYLLLNAAQRQDFVTAVKNVKAHAEVGAEGPCNYTNTYDKYVCWHKECG